MKVLSLFSGIGGFDLGLEMAGMEIAGQCEIDPYCSKVLAAHWPGVKNYGDVRNVGLSCVGLRRPSGFGTGAADTGERFTSLEPSARNLDLICGGFPCQDVSVAGNRAGLAGDRSGLWFEFQRVLSELRPRWALIENVPGLLSSNGGRDFAVILDGLEECGFGGIAWAVLDSQHFGVAQRRRRVFIVCGPTRRDVEQVLSLCESCGRHPAPSRTKGEDVARPLGASATSFGGQRFDLDNETYVPDTAYALAARNAKGISLLESAEGFDASEDGTGRGTPLLAVRTAQTSANGHGIAEDGAHTINSANGQAAAQPLRSNRWGGSDSHGDQGNAVLAASSVRRLTPTECERLQGFPDDWLPEGPDGPKYRALGNAVTVPVIEWLGRQIMALE